MTKREILQDNVDDSVLALLMDEFAESEGRRYIQENERLWKDPDAAMPADMRQRAVHFIRQEFSRQRRRNSRGRLLRILSRLAIAALIAILLFGAAFALSENVRAGTLNLLMQMDERLATWQFIDDESGSPGEVNSIDILTGWLPEGYTEGPYIIGGPADVVLDCTNDSGGLIRISVHESEDFMHTLDLEESDYYTSVKIQDCEGILTLKDDVYYVYWPYNKTEIVACVQSSDIDTEVILQVAESIRIIW